MLRNSHQIPLTSLVVCMYMLLHTFVVMFLLLCLCLHVHFTNFIAMILWQGHNSYKSSNFVSLNMQSWTQLASYTYNIGCNRMQNLHSQSTLTL
jgi:hypothetical protein